MKVSAGDAELPSLGVLNTVLYTMFSIVLFLKVGMSSGEAQDSSTFSPYNAPIQPTFLVPAMLTGIWVLPVGIFSAQVCRYSSMFSRVD